MIANTQAELREQAAHHSGYEREAALRRCADLRLPGCLQIAASRLNDWVPEVRLAAREAVIALLPFTPHGELLPTLARVHRLRHAERTDHSDWIKEFEQRVFSRFEPEVLEAIVEGGVSWAARAAYELMMSQPDVDRSRLLHLAITHRSDIVLALNGVSDCSDGEADLLSAALQSRFGAVRSRALRRLLAIRATGLAEKYLLDASSAVRRIAISHVKNQGHDPRPVYLSILADPDAGPRLQILALQTLGALRSVGDLPLVKQYLQDASLAIRRSAFRVWFRLGEAEKDQIALRALQDSAVAVRRFGSRLITQEGAYVPLVTVRQTLRARNDLPTLLACVAGLKWAMLEDIAEAAASDNAQTRELLTASLLSWTGKAKRMHDRPTPEQASWLTSGQAFAVLAPLLEGEQAALSELAYQIAHL